MLAEVRKDVTHTPLADLFEFCNKTGIDFQSIKRVGDKSYAIVMTIEQQ